MQIAITRKDGGVSFMLIVDQKANVDQEIAKWNAANKNGYVSHQVIPDGVIDSKATYADKVTAFALVSGTLSVALADLKA